MILTAKSAVEFVLPAQPTPRESFAAEELRSYLSRILGADVAANDPGAGEKIRFIIGGPARNPAAAELVDNETFDSLLTGEEGIFIRIAGNAVIIAGSQNKNDMERGTLYAAYEFLERYAGCTLAIFDVEKTNSGEIVPAVAQLELSDGQYIKAGADRPYRTAIVQYGDKAGKTQHELNVPFFGWMVKNRYNRLLLWTKTYEEYKNMGLLPELEKRGIALSVGHHDAIRLWLPFFGNDYFPEAYSQTHPEYYRLNSDGTRFMPKDKDDARGQWPFCSRNMDCIEQISSNIIAWSEENPLVDTIVLWPMDGQAEQCTCPACQPYSKVENYVYFQNEVAKRVGKARRNLKIDVILYVDLWECPDNITLEPNIFLDESTWAESGLRKGGKPDGSCLIGTDFDLNLVKWRKTGAQVVYYDYYMGIFANHQRVLPLADEIQSIWQHFVRKDIAGAGTQIECFNLWNHLVNLYAFGRTAYDVSLSLDDNLEKLCRLFGEGGQAVAQAVHMMEDTLDGQDNVHFGGRYMIRNIDRSAVYALFDRALAQTTDKRCRNNLRMMRMAFRYTDVSVFDTSNIPRDAKISLYWPLVLDYDDPTGELAYMATEFDSFRHNDPGCGITIPVTNTDTKDFVPDVWYQFE